MAYPLFSAEWQKIREIDKDIGGPENYPINAHSYRAAGL
jgi:hypothetical protein